MNEKKGIFHLHKKNGKKLVTYFIINFVNILFHFFQFSLFPFRSLCACVCRCVPHFHFVTEFSLAGCYKSTAEVSSAKKSDLLTLLHCQECSLV